MNGSVPKLLLVIRFAILRLLRQPVSTILMVGLPLVIIPMIGAVMSKLASWAPYLDGAPDAMAFSAVGLVLLFQLLSGRFSMEATRESLLSEKKWRIYAAPCSPAIHAAGTMAASTAMSLLQGLLLVAYSRLALGVRWGSVAVVIVVLLGAALLSQLVFVVLLLLIGNHGAAATLGWLFGYGSAALGGLIIPLPPDKPFWHFMATYGTPYSMAQTALVGSAGGGSRAEVVLCIVLLFALCAVVALVLSLLGRRRLA